MIRSLLMSFLLLLPAASALAAGTATTPHFTAELLAESRAPAPGKAVTLALVINPEKGWHTYWSNPGETGLAPELDWTLPQGVTAGEVRHPVPSKLVIGGIASNVHEGPVTLLTDISVPQTMPAGTALPIALSADLLICSEGSCVPETVTLDTLLKVGNGTPDPAVASVFSQARAVLPKQLAQPARFALEGGSLKLFVPVSKRANLRSTHVFFDDEDAVPAGTPQTVSESDGGVVISLPHGDGTFGEMLSGVVRTANADQGPAGYVFTAVRGAIPATASEDELGSGFLFALGGAILGGLLLNLMPCVFPILSLKALALVRAGEMTTTRRGWRPLAICWARSVCCWRWAAWCWCSRIADMPSGGPSSCKTPAWSPSCCCSSRQSLPISPASTNCRR